MSPHCIVLSLILLAGLPVETTRLDGSRQSGELKGLTAAMLQLETESGPVEIPVSEIQEVQLSTSAGTNPPLRVDLTDESQLTAEKVTITAGKLNLVSESLGELSIPTEQIHSVLLNSLSEAQAPMWLEMRKKTSEFDLLVIRKGENLDFYGGTIGSVAEDSVTLIARGRELKVSREKIVGIVYATHKMTAGNAICEATTINGARLRIKGIEIQDGQAKLTLATSLPLQLPVESLKSLDYGLGKIVPLMKAMTRQSLPPGVSESTVAVRSHAYSSSTLQKVPLLVGGKQYSEGLLIHPQTKLEFALNRQFRRLRTVVGIDENASERVRFEPVVQVQILADGKSLWEQSVRWDAQPVPLDLDLSGVKTLEIITSTADGKIGPLRHVDLADAKLIK